jgi:hypothetical protein
MSPQALVMTARLDILLRRWPLGLVAVIGLMSAWGCSRPGLVREKYPADFYEIPNSLESSELDNNPVFIMYGDNRTGWRAQRFASREMWVTWKQLLIPFYQLYLVGYGAVGGVNYLRNTPDYDSKQARQVRDAVYDEAKRSQVDFIINSGDMVTEGRHPKDWETFIEQNKQEVPLVLEYPYLPVVGNHEHANDTIYGLPNYEDVFSFPRFYELNGPDVDFFIVDSDLIIDQYDNIDDNDQDALFAKWFVSDDPHHPAWLEAGLQASDKAFKVVIMHHPLISFGRHHGNWTDPKYGRDNSGKRLKLLDLFEREGVRIVFNGHQHSYEHNVVHYSTAAGDSSAIHFIITGGGGAQLHRLYSDKELAKYRANYRDEGFDAICVRQEAIYNYCLADVTPDRLSVKVIEVSGKSETNGRLADTVTIERGAQ